MQAAPLTTSPVDDMLIFLVEAHGRKHYLDLNGPTSGAWEEDKEWLKRLGRSRIHSR